MKIIVPIRAFTEGHAVSSEVLKILKKYDVKLRYDRFSDFLNIIEARPGTILHENELLYDISYRNRQKFLTEMKLVS